MGPLSKSVNHEKPFNFVEMKLTTFSSSVLGHFSHIIDTLMFSCHPIDIIRKLQYPTREIKKPKQNLLNVNEFS